MPRLQTLHHTDLTLYWTVPGNCGVGPECESIRTCSLPSAGDRPNQRESDLLSAVPSLTQWNSKCTIRPRAHYSLLIDFNILDTSTSLQTPRSNCRHKTTGSGTPCHKVWDIRDSVNAQSAFWAAWPLRQCKVYKTLQNNYSMYSKSNGRACLTEKGEGSSSVICFWHKMQNITVNKQKIFTAEYLENSLAWQDGVSLQPELEGFSTSLQIYETRRVVVWDLQGVLY